MKLSKKISLNNKKIFFFMVIILLFFCSVISLYTIEIGRKLGTYHHMNGPDQIFTGATHAYMMKSNVGGFITITKINRDNGLVCSDSINDAVTYDLSWGYYDNFKVFKIRNKTYLYYTDYRTYTGYVYPMDNYGRIFLDGPFIDAVDLGPTYWTDAEFFTIGSQYFMLFYDNDSGNLKIYNIADDAIFNDTPIEETFLYPGVDNIEFYTADGQIYVCFHDTETSFLDFRRMNTDGTIGSTIYGDYYISSGWSDIEFYTHNGETNMILMYPYDGWIRIHRINDDGTLGGLLQELTMHTDITSINVYSISAYRDFKNIMIAGSDGAIYAMNPDPHHRITLTDDFRTANSLYVDTYSIDDYPGDYWWEDLMRPSGKHINHDHADNFANTLVAEIDENFPAINSGRMIINKDDEVTVDDYYCYIYSDFVYYSGYGANDFLNVYDGQVEPENTAYGHTTKWVIHDSPSSLANDDPLFYFPMFNGIHAVFGYASSDVREYIVLDDDCCAVCFCDGGLYGGSTRDYSLKFAELWVDNLQSMWHSYRSAIFTEVYQSLNFSIEPAVVYLRGNINGTSFNGSREILAPNEYGSSCLMFDGPVPVHNMNLEKTTIVFGTPTY